MTRLGLMRRYTNADDLGSTTSAFTKCSFWWAEALALTGQLGDAGAVFERAVRHGNPLGLFSEDIDPETAQLLGNFPMPARDLILVMTYAVVAFSIRVQGLSFGPLLRGLRVGGHQA